METVVGIAILVGVVWWIFFGRVSSGAILMNTLIILLFGAGGIALIAAGNGGGWIGLGCLAYAVYGVFKTIPHVLERMDPDGN